MSTDNTGWQPPTGGTHASPSPEPGPQQQPESASAPRYGTYAQSEQPAYGQQAPQGQGSYAGGAQYSQYAQQAGTYTAGPGGFFVAPKPGIIPLRPLTITEIIAGAFESLRANPRAMFLPAIVVMGAAGLISALFTFLAFSTLSNQISIIDSYNEYDYASVGSDQEVFNALSSYLGGSTGLSLVSTAINFFAITVLTGLLTVTVSRSVLGRIATPAEVWERVRPRLWALIGQALLVELVTGLAAFVAALGAVGLLIGSVFALDDSGSSANLGLIMLVCFLLGVGGLIAAAFLGVRLSVAGAALILENVSIWEGIRRSWQLTRGYFWRVLGVQLLVGLLVGTVSAVLGGAIGALSGAGTLLVGIGASTVLIMVSAFIGSLLDALIRPFSSAATALVYIDLRMRQEGLDVELRRSAGV
ncbi:glycerophosphodiester phosphodiesterase [Actinomyces sp. 565]|uniref:glycerophosphodiester phosphodiesterase n=1 Tax=Actinomyces sp. 565 TaxID=2057794 RepID=UPI0013A6D018|nr:glycerophosphodiester phosphodiesterase [Actinomyces sp. 565]NDR52574.1 glycerophosphodiester phosphodiesterase [Actinomyces sp. 565]